MWPRGRPQSQQSQSSSCYGPIGFVDQYPQHYNLQQQQGLGPPSRDNRQRRDRARPRHQYSYYSDDSLNSNYSNNILTSRGGGSKTRGVGRGSGTINPVNPVLLTKPPVSSTAANTNNRRPNDKNNKTNNNYNAQRMDRPSERPSRNYPGPEQYYYYQAKTNRNDYNRVKQDPRDEFVQPTMYFCPKCGENYNTRYSNNKYLGKIPLILQCSHTMCQECIYQGFKNNKVNCPTCQEDSTLTQEQTPVCQTDVQNVFAPNFYILGIMSYYKITGGQLRNLENIGFVSTSLKKSQPSLPDPSERCCFATCSKEATMFCPSCEGIYCSDCCTVVHKSTKKLMSHEPVQRRKQKFSLMLENCGEHPTMQVEFFCKDCDLTACCYCVLDKHTDHERVPLYHLNKTEMEEFKRQKKVAEKALKEILYTQKKTTRLANFNTGSVKKDVCQYFGNCHAKLESLEKKLCDELETFKANNRGLDSIQASLMASAEQLKQLVAFNEDKIGDKKLNLRGALDKLKNIDNIPRFLLNDDGQSEPVRFIVNDAAIDNLEEDLFIAKSEDSEYKLITEKELPEDYEFNDESDNEVEEAMSAILHKSNISEEMMQSFTELPTMVPASAASSIKSKKTQKPTKAKEPIKRKLGKDMERVDVQHINAMDSFFVQYKNDQNKLSQLNKEIENYVKMGGAQTVKEPQLNDLYLALYMNESHNTKEQKWCRGRLTEIKNGENGPAYDMFFIDYGKTQTVDFNRIRDIPQFLTQKRPFAVECMLYNPMGVNWNKRAHYSLAKILIGKDVYMMEKSQNNGIYEVDLMIASSDGGITSITDILVHAHNSVEPLDDTSSVDGTVVRKDGYYPMLRVFPNSKKFTKGQKEKIIVATVVDPHNMFVHLVQHQEAFKSMNHAIKKAYKSARTSGCIPIEGTYVLVEYKDAVRSNWHRAFIKSVDLNSDKVHVLLVDWGLNVVVSTGCIRALQESFTKLESQAVLVKLAHIAPYSKQGMWSTYASNFLQAYHKSQDVLKMVVQETDPEVEVALFDVSGNVDICLNAMMVENNLADSTGPISTKVEWPQFQLTNPEFTEEEGLMSSMLKRVDAEANDDSDEEDLTDVKKRQTDVVKVEGPDLIWVKFLEFRERESTMFKDLQIHYSQEQNVKGTWKIGEQCVAEVGHEYSRGKIVEMVGDEYKVYLLDKVKEVVSPIDKIYVYDKYFAKYPQAVIKSHLANIRPAGDTGKWSSSSVDALQQIFSKHKRIYANKAPETITDLARKSLPLDMWYGLVIQGGPLDPDRIKYVSINNSLVKLGFAYKVPRPVAPEASTAEAESLVKKAATGEDLLKSLVNLSLDSQESLDQQSVQDISSSDTTMDPTDTPSVTTVAVIEKIPEIKMNEPKAILEKDKHATAVFKLLVQGGPDSHADKKTKKPKKKLKEDVAQKSLDEIEVVPDEENKNDQKPQEDAKEKSVETVKESPKKHRKSNDELPIQNWNAIVEQELGGGGDELEQQDSTNAEQQDSPYHKSEVAIDDWLPSLRLTEKEFRARVTCVETGGHLYLHEQAVDDVYYKMEANIKEYFDKNPPGITDHQWAPGQLCTIKFTDGNWYRGKILRIKSPEEISVFMIDFGSDHDLSPMVLFREVLYTNIGSFATKVKLDKVYSRSGPWLTSDYDHFHDLVTDWCKIVVKGPVDVEQPLVDVYNEHGVFVNQKLVELCPNLSRCSSFPIEGVNEEDDDTVVIESIENEAPYADEMLMDSVDKELVVREASSKETCMPDYTKEIFRYKMRPLPRELIKGHKVVMEIGGILNFDKVALRIPGEDVSEEMYDLVTEIQDVVESLPNLKEFVVGMPCLAPFSEDEVWYRARITGTNTVDLGLVDVIFVDYGNSEAVSTKNLKMIRPDYMNLPQQSWEASLNVALEKDADVITVMQVINSLDKKRKYVKLVQPNPLIVDLYDKNELLCYESLVSSGALKPLHEG